MKKLLLATSALVVLAGPAFSADLPSRKEAALPPPPPPMWTGFYAGLNAGYNFGTNANANSQNLGGNWTSRLGPAFSIPNLAPIVLDLNDSPNQDGFIGGAQFGYNYQYGSNFVLGVETDIQGAGIRGSNSGLNAASLAPSPTWPANGNTLYGGNTFVQAGIDYLGTVRGRLGYLVNPTLLLYGTGGFAYGGAWANVTQQAATNVPSYPIAGGVLISTIGGGHQNQLLTGWTAGGGLEWMFMSNWSLKGEALYWDLGRMNVNTTNYSGAPVSCFLNTPAGWGRTSVNYSGVQAKVGLNYHFNWAAEQISAIASPALSADLPSRKGAAPQPTLAPQWSGLYAGLNAGYNFGTNANVNSQNVGTNWNSGLLPVFGLPNAAPIALDLNKSIFQDGFIGGGQFGYNYQYSTNFVLGVETDIQGAGIRGSRSDSGASILASKTLQGADSQYTGNTVVQAGVDYLGTVRGRLGYLATPTLLIYGTGGFAYGGAWANVSQQAVTTVPGYVITGGIQASTFGGGNQNQLLTGWTAGGGLEWMFMSNWSLKGEALYWDLGGMNANTTNYSGSPALGFLGSAGGWGRTSVNYSGIQSKVGVNYHFNWDTAPIVAKF